jgi:hypothetical protein
MSSNNVFKSDLFGLHNIIQASMLVYPKEIILATLRDFFSKDSFYHFSKNSWGYPNTTDHTDLPPGADIPYGAANSTANPQDRLSTRVFIGENYRYDGIYYPAILVKSGGSKYVPVSINREQGGIKYESIVYDDGYGQQVIVNRPAAFITAGAWEGSIAIDVLTRSLRSRDDLVELIGMAFAEITVDSLYDIGVVVKPPNISAPSETDDRNDKLFRQTITMDIRTEWRRCVPIENVIDAIFFSATIEDISKSAPIANNLTINTEVSLIDQLLRL